ncbi:MAG: amidohydrolase family protein [Bacteroidetes bacterium]|nr:amidohydrolase family protein [Bacteroidota bacterium]
MKIIDTHQHFWNYDAQKQDWINEDMQAIRKDFLPTNLAIVLKENNVEACISVQAEQSLQETDFLLAQAKANNFIQGVVGWVDLCDLKMEQALEKYAAENLLKGFRHILQGEADGFMLQESFIQGLKKLQANNYTYDLLIYAHQLKEANELVKHLPTMPIVIDHIAKPNIKAGKIEEWKKEITGLANYPNVYCKISGMVTEANWNNWTAADLKPYLDLVVAAFGTERIMFGSDWPVCLVASTYSKWLNLVQNYFNTFSSSEQEAIFAGNAIKFYKL